MTPTPAPLVRLRAVVLAVPPARLRLAFLAALAVVVAVTAARYCKKAATPSDLGTYTRTAFLRWRPQVIGGFHADGRPIPGLMQGADAYRLYNYPNPPVMALVLWPFMALPPLTGALLWFAVKVGMAAACFHWAFRLVAGSGPPLPDWAKAATILLGLHPVLGDLSHGNVNIFIAFLVLGALDLYRRGYDVACGLTLALAVACKVTPALFLPYLVWKRAWRAAAAAGVGLVLWFLVVPGAALGWERNVTLLGGWFDGMVRPFLVDGKVTSEHANQSIPGVVFRLLTAEPSVIGYDDDDKPFAAAFHNLTDVGTPAARWVIRGCQGAFVLAVVLLCRARGRAGPWVAAECSLIVLGMLLFSERTWKHHGVTLLLPFATLLGFLALRPLSPAARGVVGGLLAAVAALTLGPGLLGRDGQDLALTYGSHTAAFLLLAAGVCGVMASERRDAADRPAT